MTTIERGQLVLGADARAALLAEAIEEHRRMVRGPGPYVEFGRADEWLYGRAREIMGGDDGGA
jgi:hypothetical protein